MDREKFWESLSDEEWLEMDETMMGRICDDAKEPFKLEDFCIQIGWVEVKECPVYPYGFQNPPCEYLYKPGFENYRCPNVRVPREIFRPIIERGTPEQKQALEKWANTVVKYNSMENPPLAPDTSHIYSAVWVYQGLGLTEKAEQVVEKFNLSGDCLI